jgi:uncharacterized protein YjhX (UPF0386 family)
VGRGGRISKIRDARRRVTDVPTVTAVSGF